MPSAGAERRAARHHRASPSPSSRRRRAPSPAARRPHSPPRPRSPPRPARGVGSNEPGRRERPSCWERGSRLAAPVVQAAPGCSSAGRPRSGHRRDHRRDGRPRLHTRRGRRLPVHHQDEALSLLPLRLFGPPPAAPARAGAAALRRSRSRPIRVALLAPTYVFTNRYLNSLPQRPCSSSDLDLLEEGQDRLDAAAVVVGNSLALLLLL